MTSIQLKCKLLSDIIISQSTATEGSQRTLDYIPGSSFLGLAASKLYNNGLDGEIAMQLFHNGKVIYGDAHPLINNTRALRIPSYWYIAKGETLREGIYPQHLFATRDGKQPKQCRTGYVVFNNDNTFLEYTPNHRFAIKSGYDRDKRRSKDEKMYGYQSLVEGSEWAFEISYDENSVNEDTVMLLINAIVGNQQIGKSKTAEYGQVEIKQEDFVSFNSTSDPGDHCLIYAESRLMFLDNDGQPTYKPTPEQLGINNGSINWAKSQIRTFQFAPFNSKRKTRDSERCVIEKGSVFYIDKLPGYEINEKMVGCFINEGFGKTIVNPGFLLTDEMGKIKYTCQPIEDMESFTTITEDIELSDENKSILSYLLKSRKTETSQTEIYRKVNKFITDHGSLFIGKEKFASQWGTIRSIALQSISKQDLIKQLFSEPDGYLLHGVAAEKWKEQNRIGKLRHFIDGFTGESETIAVKTIVNLAAEMAKKCKEDKQ